MSQARLVSKIASTKGPIGDTKFDIFDQAGLSRAQMRAMRTGRPLVPPSQRVGIRHPLPPSVRFPAGGVI